MQPWKQSCLRYNVARKDKLISTCTSALLRQVVEVAVSTVEDEWAVRLVDMMAGLHQLRVEGVTREMYIWGNVQVKLS